MRLQPVLQARQKGLVDHNYPAVFSYASVRRPQGWAEAGITLGSPRRDFGVLRV
jgi:hypothetical protein